MDDPARVPSAQAPVGAPRRRTHPVTPFVHGIRSIPTIIAIAFLFGADLVDGVVSLLRTDPDGVALADLLERTVAQESPQAVALVVLLAGAVLVALTSGGAWLRWRATTYWFDEDGDLRVDSGVLARHHRRLQLSRLQTVDVVQPLAARLFGMNEMRIEVAGQGESRARLQFLDEPTAQSLRAEILARAGGVRADAGEAPEVVLVRVPTGAFVTSLLLTTRVWVAVAITAISTVSAVATAGIPGLASLLVTGSVPLLVVVQEFNRFHGFTVADSPDGLRLRHGLLQTYAQTVPPGRVQAVSVVEPLLWRRRGWVRIRVNLAGVGTGESEGVEDTLLVPVAPRHVADTLLRRALPGVTLADIPLSGVDRKVRWRAPVQWGHLGVGWDERVLVTRRGRITRHTAVVPHARTQSVRVTQGPWQRLIDVASMHVDSTPGPVRIVVLHRRAQEARRLAHEQAARAVAARSSDRSIRWASPGRDG